jgi:hypothetical protein
MKMKKRAWQDARQDYLVEQAFKRKLAWRIFWVFTLLGIGYRFFSVGG